jgi:hypothetical protein
MCYANSTSCTRRGETWRRNCWIGPGPAQEASVASYRQELEKRGADGIPSLDDIEPGKIVGAVIPMSERAQTQMRDSIEVIDYLLNQERVVWS